MCFMFSGLEWESLIVTRPLVSAYQEQVTERCSLEMSWLTGLDFGLHRTISKASLCQGSRYTTTETWTLHFYPFSTHYHHEVASLDLENSAVILFLINKIFFLKKKLFIISSCFRILKMTNLSHQTKHPTVCCLFECGFIVPIIFNCECSHCLWIIHVQAFIFTVVYFFIKLINNLEL